MSDVFQIKPPVKGHGCRRKAVPDLLQEARECDICGAEEWTQVQRAKSDHTDWKGWEPGDHPIKGFNRHKEVVIEKNGLCAECAEHKRKNKKKVCRACGATEGQIVARNRRDLDDWTDDIPKAERDTSAWHPAKVVRFKTHASIRCEDCALDTWSEKNT